MNTKQNMMSFYLFFVMIIANMAAYGHVQTTIYDLSKPELENTKPLIKSLYDPPVAGYVLAKKWDELSDKEKKRIRKARDRYKKLPSDKKEKLRRKWEKMSPEEKKKYKLEKRYR